VHENKPIFSEKIGPAGKSTRGADKILPDDSCVSIGKSNRFAEDQRRPRLLVVSSTPAPSGSTGFGVFART
jgi:hypothetical protein